MDLRSYVHGQPICGAYCKSLAGRRCIVARGRLFQQRLPVKHNPRERSRRIVVTTRASYGGASEDPYKVLGLPSSANSEQVNRVYRNKLRDAKGNEAEIARIESAHTAIMMQFFSRRSKGGESIPKDVKYADRAVYFPWRPRRNMADKKVILVTAALQAVFALYGVCIATAGNQPILAATSVGFVANLFKQNQLYPVASGFEASDKDKRQGVRNLVRSGGLALGATFLGCFLFFTFPDWLAEQAGRLMPIWWYEKEKALLAVGTALANWIMVSFFC